jgi:dipeptidyl aminopeptidase/acylaminoacyl peptidase
VPGSTGLSIGFLTISQSGRIFASASSLRDHQCGAYEIDPDAATHRAIRAGAPPGCAGALGKISPDGKNLLSTHWSPRTPGSPPSVEYLSLLDLETGTTQSLGEGRGSWSPDGRWIAISVHGRIVLIDARNTSQRKGLGASGVDGNLIWSPDSKQLLLAKQERRCSFLYLFQVDDSESLEVVDVETGKRRAIPSAHCAVTSSAVGWIDPRAFR